MENEMNHAINSASENTVNVEETKKRLFSVAEGLMQESAWRKVRVFFKELEDISDSLTVEERDYFLSECCDLMLHPKSQVRRIVGHTTGVLLADLEDQLPVIWEKTLRKILFPGDKVDEQRARWLSYSLMQLMDTAVSRMQENRKRQLLRVYESYFRSVHWSQRTCIILLGGIMEIRPEEWTPLQRHEMIGFMRQILKGSWSDVITLSLYVLKTWMDCGWKPQDDELRYLQHFELPETAVYAQRYLQASLTSGGEKAIPESERPSDLVLIQQDMQVEQDWAKKLAHLAILKDRLGRAGSGEEAEGIRNFYVSHLQNMLRMNSHPMVFLRVGESLLEILPEMPETIRCEIMQDMLKELEMGVDSANFVASFIGRGFWLLDAEDRKDFTQQFLKLTDHQDSTTAETVLEVLAIICRKGVKSSAVNAPAVNEPAGEQDRMTAWNVLTELGLPGILMKGKYSHHQEIAIETEFLLDYYGLNPLRETYGAHEVVPGSIPTVDAAGNKRKVAFFTSSFDPFTARDKAIVREITAMGFDVCLNISLFAWKKNLQPARIRRQLLKLSVADLQHVELLPEDFPVYIRNHQDQEKLRQLYAGCELWLVRESTQLDTADSCGARFPHIVYFDSEMQGQMNREAIRQVLQKEVIFLQLPLRYQGGTSENVQDRIRSGRNITGYVDLHAERMITDWKLYQDLPTFKKTAATKTISTEISGSQVSIYAWEGDRFCRGKVDWRRAGKTAVITVISGDCTGQEDYRNLALLEFLAYCQGQNLAHVVCFDAARYRRLLEPFGFLQMEEYEDGMTLDLSQVIVLFLDAKEALKEPYCTNPEVCRTIRRNELRIRQAVAELYPGKLILGFPADIMNTKVIQMIEEDTNPELVCVPFGKMLKQVLIPNHITRDLNTEKRYNADLSEFEISEFPEYPSMQAQIDSLKSFGAPVILVDDLYHKGYRFAKITEMTKVKDVQIDSLAVSVLSGRGIDLARGNQLKVHSVYTVPNMSVWLMETDLYPFVGGDGIVSQEDQANHTGAQNSINPILPYEVPHFLKGSSMKAIYSLSRICLENAKALYETLEEEYRREEKHMLTFERIGEVMVEPRCPIGIPQEGSRRKKVSQLLQDELDKLGRLRM